MFKHGNLQNDKLYTFQSLQTNCGTVVKEEEGMVFLGEIFISKLFNKNSHSVFEMNAHSQRNNHNHLLFKHSRRNKA